jgi:hypothetical protein
MTERPTVLSVLTALMVTLAAPLSFATEPPTGEDDESESEKNQEKPSGNAADKATSPSATAKPTGADTASRPPINYTQEAVDFWSLFLSSGSPFVGALAGAHNGPGTLALPDLQLAAPPSDAPAESILDQLDERLAPPVLVGAPGSEASSAAGSGNNAGAGTASAPAASTGETPTPPPESILDFIDTAPAPKPAVTREATKPAVNQAPKASVVETKP